VAVEFDEHPVGVEFGEGVVWGEDEGQALVGGRREGLQGLLEAPHGHPVAELVDEGHEAAVVAVKRRLQLRHEGHVVLRDAALERARVGVHRHQQVLGALARRQDRHG